MHELLAAEPNIAASHNIISDETLKVFGHPEHFLKIVKRERYFDEKDAEKLDKEEIKDNTTSVADRLAYSFGRSFIGYLDFLAQALEIENAADRSIERPVGLDHVIVDRRYIRIHRYPRHQIGVADCGPALRKFPVLETAAVCQDMDRSCGKIVLRR